MSQIKTLFFCLLLTPSVFAHLYSDVDASLGFTSINVTAGNTFEAKLEEAIFEFNYNLNYAGPNIAFNINFAEVVKDGFTNISYTRMGLGARWYFFGFNGQKLIIDNQTSGLILRPTPYIGSGVGMSNFSITEGGPGDFNASNLDLTIYAGLEVPLTSTFLLMLQAQGLTNITSSEEEGRNISYLGFSFHAGIKVSSF